MSKFDHISVITVKEALVVNKFVFCVEFRISGMSHNIVCEDNFNMRSAIGALAMANKLAEGKPYSIEQVQERGQREHLEECGYATDEYTWFPPYDWSVHYVDQFGRKCEVELHHVC